MDRSKSTNTNYSNENGVKPQVESLPNAELIIFVLLTTVLFFIGAFSIPPPQP